MKDIFLTVLTKFGTKGLNLFTFIILARNLSIEEFGLYGFIFTTSLLLSVLLDTGFRNSSAFYIGKSPKQVTFSANILLLSWVLLFPLMVALCWISFNYSGLESSTTNLHYPIVVITASLLFIRMAQGIHLGDGNIAQINRSELIPKTLLFISIFVGYLTGSLNLTFALWAFALSSLLGAAYLLHGMKNYIGSSDPTIDKNLAKKIFKRGLLFMLGALLMIAYKKTGFYVVSFMDGSSSAGAYFGVNRLAEVLTEIGLAISLVLFSKNVRNTNQSERLASTAKTLRTSLFLLTIFGLFCIPLAPIILPLALGNEFTGFENLYRIAIVAAVLGIIPTVIFPTLAIIFKPLTVAVWYLLGLLMSSSLSIIAFENYGLNGVVLVLAITNVVLTSIIIFSVTNKYGGSPFDYLLLKRSDVILLIKTIRQN